MIPFSSKNETKQTVYQIIDKIDSMNKDKIISQFGVECEIGMTCHDQWGCDKNNDENMFNKNVLDLPLIK